MLLTNGSAKGWGRPLACRLRPCAIPSVKAYERFVKVINTLS